MWTATKKKDEFPRTQHKIPTDEGDGTTWGESWCLVRYAKRVPENRPGCERRFHLPTIQNLKDHLSGRVKVEVFEDLEA